MPNSPEVTLIGTYHAPVGRCNETELYAIVEEIAPDIIFEETPPSYYDAYYIQRTRAHNPEHAVISRYSNAYNIPHIPVDSDDVPPESFFAEHKRMIGQVRGRANHHAWNYRSISEASFSSIEKYGFHYLNSDRFIRHDDELTEILVSALKEIGNEDLLEFKRKYDAIIDKRENEMLANIYRYSSQNRYDNAVFLIGAGHRKSIIQKLDGYEFGDVKLTWTLADGGS